jgi:hypothetical protein
MSQIPTTEDRFAIIRAIANACSFAEMDRLTHVCIGERVIHEIAAPGSKQFEIAQLALDWFDRRGYENNLISIIVRAKALEGGDAAAQLEKTVMRVLPSALSVSPAVDGHVDRVVAALNELKATLSRGQNKERVGIFKSALKEVAVRICRLMIYKELHDNLHRIQLSPKWKLLHYAGQLNKEGGEEAGDYITLTLQQITVAVSACRNLVQRFTAETESTQQEIFWIDGMEDATNRCEKGLENGDLGAIKNGLNKIFLLIDTNSQRLNNSIFAETKSLPLSALEKPLTEMDGEATNAQVDNTLSAIALLRSVLMNRVAAHNRLQEAEMNMEILSQYLRHPDEESLVSSFADLWPEIKDTVETLTVYGLGTRAVGVDSKRIDAVESALAELASSPRGNQSTRSLIVGLELAFNKFHDRARIQFFEVDSQLKSDFGKLSEIARSLDTLIGELQ